MMSTDIIHTDEYGRKTPLGNVHISVAYDMIEHYSKRPGSVVIESAMDFAISGSAQIGMPDGSVIQFIDLTRV